MWPADDRPPDDPTGRRASWEPVDDVDCGPPLGRRVPAPIGRSGVLRPCRPDATSRGREASRRERPVAWLGPTRSSMKYEAVRTSLGVRRNPAGSSDWYGTKDTVASGSLACIQVAHLRQKLHSPSNRNNGRDGSIDTIVPRGSCNGRSQHPRGASTRSLVTHTAEPIRITGEIRDVGPPTPVRPRTGPRDGLAPWMRSQLTAWDFACGRASQERERVSDSDEGMGETDRVVADTLAVAAARKTRADEGRGGTVPRPSGQRVPR